MAMTNAVGDASSLTLSIDGATGTILKDRAQTFTLGPEEFRITKQGFFVQDLELWTSDVLLASARKSQFSYAGGEWKLKCTKWWSEIEYTVYQDKNPVGFIRSTRSRVSRFFGVPSSDFKEVVIDLPEEFPAVVQVFLTWVACYLWTNVDGASSGD